MTSPRAAPALRRGRAALWLATCLVCVTSACDEPSVRLPNTWNTLKQRRVTVDPYAPIAAPADKLRPLNGMDGAPRALHPELADVLVP